MREQLLSVIVCTYNRASYLSVCLASLTEQIASESKVDILIVDNNSSDNTAQIASGYTGLNCRYIFEGHQGLSIARNRGMRESKSEWVAYLDDDAFVGDGWIEEILFLIKTGEYDAFGGIYLPWYNEGRKKWFKDDYATNKQVAEFHIKDRFILTKFNFSGGNCAYKRSILIQVGGFNAGLGMKGEHIYYGEESYVQSILRKKGYIIGFSKKMIIHHLVQIERQNLRWQLISQWRKGRVYWNTIDKTPKVHNKIHIFLAIPLGVIRRCKALIRSFFSSKSIYYQQIIIEILGFVLKSFGKLTSSKKGAD